MTNRATRRASRPRRAANGRATGPRNGRRRSSVGALLVLLAVVGLIVLAVASSQLVAAPAVTPLPS